MNPATESVKMARPNFSGKWKLNRSDQFEEYLAAQDVNVLGRKVALTVIPVHEIHQDGDTLTIKVYKPFGNQEAKFIIGDEFDTVVHMSVIKNRYRCSTKWDGDKLVLHYKALDKNKKDFTQTREIISDEMLVTFETGGVVCKRFYKKM